jgi:gluconate 2-dehydrogenase gamma chain
MSDLHNRRAFLRAAAAASAVWATVDLLDIEEALAWASLQVSEPMDPKFSIFTPEQAEVIALVTSRILPSVDGRPGASEAGAVYFIDRSLATFNMGQRQLYADGVTDLNTRAVTTWGASPGFTSLTEMQQDTLLRAIENRPFFQAARFDTIVGTFALPTWGGNRDYAGWHLLNLTHRPIFAPPFGFYDTEVNRKE